MQISKARREEIDDMQTRRSYRERIMKYSDRPLQGVLEFHADPPYFGADVPVV